MTISGLEKIIEYVRSEGEVTGIISIVVDDRVLGILAVIESGSLLKKKVFEAEDYTSIPIIIISKPLFIGDVYYDVVGDYVASYLLLPLKIIYDKKKLLEKAVLDVRRRIVDEEVSILASYGKILSYAVIPIEYFPIKALSVRIKLYSTLRSIVERIPCILEPGKIREVFRETYYNIIEFIVEKNRLEFVDPYHVKLSDKIFLEPGYRKYIPRIKEKMSPIAMSITSLLVDERLQSSACNSIPVEFAKPHLMIKMEEGILGLGDWRELLENRYGVLRKEGKTSIVYATEIYRAGKKKIVVKQYTSPSSIKWVLASIASILSKKFIVNSWERQYNEYKATLLLASKGFPHRRVLVVDPISAVTVFEYIEGTPIIELARNSDRSAETAYRLTGRLLGELHLNNMVIGDTKPDNFILTASKDKVVPIDLEQMSETSSIEERAWDIAMFIYFHGASRGKIPSHYIELVNLFLREYVETVKDKNIVVEAGKLKYQLPFMYIVPLNNLLQLANTIKTFSQSL